MIEREKLLPCQTTPNAGLSGDCSAPRTSLTPAVARGVPRPLPPPRAGVGLTCPTCLFVHHSLPSCFPPDDHLTEDVALRRLREGERKRKSSVSNNCSAGYQGSLLSGGVPGNGTRWFLAGCFPTGHRADGKMVAGDGFAALLGFLAGTLLAVVLDGETV